MSQSIGQTLKKLIPTFVLIALAYLAGGTSVFDDRVHQIVGKAFTDFGAQLLPFAINLLVSLVVLNIAYVFYHPVKDTALKAMLKARASERAQLFGIKALALLYWFMALLIALTIIFPDVFSKLLLGASLLGAAITLALQGAANDFICGVLLQFTPKFKIGDEIIIGGLALDGKDVTGRVTDINYLATTLVTASGTINVPNRELWSRPVKVIDPNYRAPDSVPTTEEVPSSTA
ncbi:MAG: mechanosensitive ion channel family protein [Candidatus Obscuribacterales bacterium]|nr:mechanosensitive ion channel family protein [Candidatus Obscuribacterales bacterium]